MTKADGNLLEAAKRTASDYKGAIQVLQMSSSNMEKVWKPRVLLTSSAQKEGFDELWQAIQDYREHLKTTGKWEVRRQKQKSYWMWKQFTRMMQDRILENPDLAQHAKELESELLQGNLTPRVAAQGLLDELFSAVSRKPP